MRFRRVAADQQDRPAVVDVVHRVRHGAVAPGVGNTRDRGRVTDTRLVIDVVGAPVGGELAEQVGLLVAELRRTEPVDAVGSAFLADLQHPVADLVDGVVPGHADPLAADLLHRIFQAALAMDVVARRCTLGAMGAEIDRAVPGGLLPDPDVVAHFRHHGATDRAVGADRFDDLDLAVRRRRGRGPGDRAAGDGKSGQPADGQTGPAQEGAAIDRFLCSLGQDRLTPGASRNPVRLFPEHFFLPLDLGLGPSFVMATGVRASRNRHPYAPRLPSEAGRFEIFLDVFGPAITSRARARFHGAGGLGRPGPRYRNHGHGRGGDGSELEKIASAGGSLVVAHPLPPKLDRTRGPLHPGADAPSLVAGAHAPILPGATPPF